MPLQDGIGIYSLPEERHLPFWLEPSVPDYQKLRVII